MFTEGCEIRLEMLDVSVKGDGGIRNDFVLVQVGGTSLWHLSFCDSGSEHDFLSSGIFVFTALDGGCERSWGVHQVSVGVEVEDGFLLVADFHVTHVDGVCPTLRIQRTQAGGIQNAVEDSMALADVESVVVLAIHEDSVVDLQRKLFKVVGKGKNIKLRLRKESDVLVD